MPDAKCAYIDRKRSRGSALGPGSGGPASGGGDPPPAAGGDPPPPGGAAGDEPSGCVPLKAVTAGRAPAAARPVANTPGSALAGRILGRTILATASPALAPASMPRPGGSG